MILEIEQQQRGRITACWSAPGTAPSFSPYGRYSATFPARQKIFTEHLVVHQLNAHLVSRGKRRLSSIGLALAAGADCAACCCCGGEELPHALNSTRAAATAKLDFMPCSGEQARPLEQRDH